MKKTKTIILKKDFKKILKFKKKIPKIFHKDKGFHKYHKAHFPAVNMKNQ